MSPIFSASTSFVITVTQRNASSGRFSSSSICYLVYLFFLRCQLLTALWLHVPQLLHRHSKFSSLLFFVIFFALDMKNLLCDKTCQRRRYDKTLRYIWRKVFSSFRKRRYSLTSEWLTYLKFHQLDFVDAKYGSRECPTIFELKVSNVTKIDFTLLIMILLHDVFLISRFTWYVMIVNSWRKKIELSNVFLLCERFS